MSRLAKSSHVVLREGASNLGKHGAPRYMVDRMAILAEVARDNREDASRLIQSLYRGLAAESEVLGDSAPNAEGAR